MSIFHIINFKKKSWVLDFFNKKLFLDYYFCLKSGPVFLFQIFIIFRYRTSHMVLSIIILEDKHKIVLHLSIFYEYQQFFQHRICFSIQPPDYSDPWPTLARSTSFFLIMLFNYHVIACNNIINKMALKICVRLQC